MSTADYANRAPIGQAALDILRQVSDQAALAPRPCVNCTDIWADACPACYAKLYPRPTLPVGEGENTGDPQ